MDELPVKYPRDAGAQATMRTPLTHGIGIDQGGGERQAQRQNAKTISAWPAFR